MTKINKKEEELKQKFFNTPTLYGEEKTSKDFEKLLFQMKLNRVQRIIKRKKKSKNFDVANKEYLEMKSKIGGL
jgi:hypothetical protein